MHLAFRASSGPWFETEAGINITAFIRIAKYKCPACYMLPLTQRFRPDDSSEQKFHIRAKNKRMKLVTDYEDHKTTDALPGLTMGFHLCCYLLASLLSSPAFQ